MGVDLSHKLMVIIYYTAIENDYVIFILGLLSFHWEC